MRKLFAIVGREWRAYFLSPLAYVILTAYMFLNGLIFSRIVAFLSAPGGPRERFLSLLFTNTFFWIFTLFIVPILTMRLLAEERRSGTLEVLLTSPVSEGTVVVGKFLGALGFFMVVWVPSLLFILYLRSKTDVDLGAVTDTGDREGRLLERHDAPSPAELEQRLAGLRGEIELPVPAASAVKIGGERAYRLHRRGVEVEMPRRRSRVDALDVISYDDGVARLDLRVSSGTYVRAIAAALGGHCVMLRRTEVGPFLVEEADPDRFIPPEEALARVGVRMGSLEAP